VALKATRYCRFIVLLAAATVLSPGSVFACASCGSGGDDPLILYPWESWKVYGGFSHTSDFTPIDAQGEVARELGPQSRNSTIVSVGHTFSSRFFTTVTAPYIVNRRASYERSGWGDPMITARYTVVQQDVSEEWLPQVQVLAAYRSSQATSIYDYEDPARLDVFGVGVSEARAGIDIWQGMRDVKAGLAQTVTVPVESRNTDFGVIRPGTSLRSTATVGYGWGDRGKILFGMNREQTLAKTLDGKEQKDSEVLSHSLFCSADAKFERHSSIRVTASRAAAIGSNKNTNRNDTYTVALMRAI
jgi:hypothetical protein